MAPQFDDPLVQAAKNLRPLLALDRAENRDGASVRPEVIEAVGTAGLFRMSAPREAGGLETPPHVATAALMEIAGDDPAVAWCAMGSVPACMAAARLDPAARQLLFADPRRNFGFAPTLAGEATPVNGGYRLTGDWPFVTGVETAAWCALNGVVIEGDQARLFGASPDRRLFLVPAGEVEVVAARDTEGNAFATRGGCRQARVRRLFVSEEFASSPRKRLQIDRPLYRIPYRSVAAAMIAGICAGVLAAAVQSAPTVVTSTMSEPHGDEATGAALVEVLSRAEAASRSLRAGVLDIAAMLWTAAASDGRPDEKLCAVVDALAFYAAEVAADTISRLDGLSPVGHVEGNPFDQAAQNIDAMLQRIAPLRLSSRER